MHYSAILILTTPNELTPCLQELADLASVEVHYEYPESGRLIAVQESNSLEEQKENLQRIQSLPSVLMAQLVYHYLDKEPGTRDLATTETIAHNIAHNIEREEG
jgi:nitrate reductase NapD